MHCGLSQTEQIEACTPSAEEGCARSVRGDSPLRYQLARGAAWMLASSAAAQAAALVASVLAARILGERGFGQLSMLRNCVLMWGALAGAGLGMAAIKCVAELRATSPLRCGRAIGLLLLTALLMGSCAAAGSLVLARPLATWLWHAPELTAALRLVAPLVLLNAVGGVQIGCLAGCEAFPAIARLSLVEGLLNIFCIALGALYGGAAGAIAGSAAVIAVMLGLRQALLIRVLRSSSITIAWRQAAAEWNLLPACAVPSVLVYLALPPAEWLARVLVTRNSDGFQQLGLFTAAWSLAQLVAFLPQQVASAAEPLLAREFARARLPVFRGALRGSLAVALISGSAAAGCVACIAPWLMQAYGQGFNGGIQALLLLLPATLLNSLGLTLRAALLAAGRAWSQVRFAAVLGLSLAALSMPLARYGAAGLAGAYTGAYAVVFCLQMAATWRAGLLSLAAPADRRPLAAPSGARPHAKVTSLPA